MEEPKPIGGYLELETSLGKGFMHSDGVMLASGRMAEEVVLQSLQPVMKLWIPYFTCKVVLEPLDRLSIPYVFYHIDRKLEIIQNIELGENEYLLYTNYFGIKDEYVSQLACKYKEHLIVDNAQALYAVPSDYLNAIYSPRKFVGIPDGGIAYSSRSIDVNGIDLDTSSYDRCSHLLKRIDGGASFGYGDFRENAEKLSSLPLLQMSQLTRKLMMAADYGQIKERRTSNFEYLHENLKQWNRFDMPSTDSFACPLTYPFLVQEEGLKQYLISNKVFVATYWPNVFDWCKEGETEYELARGLIHLPIDQRYDRTDMDRIIQLIKSWKS